VNASLASSAGRRVDAMAAVLVLCVDRESLEGEAAMALEAAAGRAPSEDGARPYTFGPERDGQIGLASLWAEVAQDMSDGIAPETIAFRFHVGLARSFVREALRLVESGEASAVALSGGCFQNALLLELTLENLGDVPVLIHTRVPANDGGLALGQALVAAARALSDR